MSNPETVVCPEGVWTKVAANVTSAVVKKMIVRPNLYLETYRNTGEAAPVDNSDANPIIGDLAFSDATASDIYVKAVGADGKVRVDL